MKNILMLIVLIMPSMALSAGGSSWPNEKAWININDTVSLQKGAALYMNYCLGCHSLKYQRYQILGSDLQLTKEQVLNNFVFTDQKIGEYITTSIDKKMSEGWFGTAPPDLTLVARSRGADWLYTYLKSFYKDSSKPWGVNNAVFENVAMPHVLEGLQGLRKPEFNEDGKLVSLTDAEGGSLSAEEYDLVLRDLVNFLVYTGEPAKSKREKVGLWVLLFILVFFGAAYLLKKEYWKDVK